MDKKTEKTSKRKESSEVPAASAPAAAKPTGKKAKKVDTSSIKVEGNSRKRKTIEAAAADMPEAKEAGTSAAAAASGGRQRSKASARAAQSPARKSQRQQKEQEAQQQQADEDNGPAVSGAGEQGQGGPELICSGVMQAWCAVLVLPHNCACMPMPQHSLPIRKLAGIQVPASDIAAVAAAQASLLNLGVVVLLVVLKQLALRLLRRSFSATHAATGMISPIMATLSHLTAAHWLNPHPDAREAS